MTLRSETKVAFTLSNARLFYSSMRRGTGNTGLTTTTPSQKLCPPLINPLTPRSETLKILLSRMPDDLLVNGWWWFRGQWVN